MFRASAQNTLTLTPRGVSVTWGVLATSELKSRTGSVLNGTFRIRYYSPSPEQRRVGALLAVHARHVLVVWDVSDLLRAGRGDVLHEVTEEGRQLVFACEWQLVLECEQGGQGDVQRSGNWCLRIKVAVGAYECEWQESHGDLQRGGPEAELDHVGDYHRHGGGGAPPA